MTRKLFYMIGAFLIPPIVVGMLEGVGFHLFINIVCWILGCGIGGIIHAWYIILTRHVEVVK